MAAVDHGPHAPSIAIARMAVTCGLPLNGAMASAINVLDDIHGGAGQQCMELYRAIAAAAGDGDGERRRRRRRARSLHRRRTAKIVPGLRPPLSPRRSARGALLALVREAAGGRRRVAAASRASATRIEQPLTAHKGGHIPMNIDGATAVIYCELGFAPELGRGLFILSRSVGILAHAWEQTQQGGRIKGPMPPEIPYRYSGPARRPCRRGQRPNDERSPAAKDAVTPMNDRSRTSS